MIPSSPDNGLQESCATTSFRLDKIIYILKILVSRTMNET